MAAKVSKRGPIFAAETGPPDRFFFCREAWYVGLVLSTGDPFWLPKSVRVDTIWQPKSDRRTSFGRQYRHPG